MLEDREGDGKIPFTWMLRTWGVRLVGGCYCFSILYNGGLLY